jgi:hypothetical protein
MSQGGRLCANQRHPQTKGTPPARTVPCVCTMHSATLSRTPLLLLWGSWHASTRCWCSTRYLALIRGELVAPALTDPPCSLSVLQAPAWTGQRCTRVHLVPTPLFRNNDQCQDTQMETCEAEARADLSSVLLRSPEPLSPDCSVCPARGLYSSVSLNETSDCGTLSLRLRALFIVLLLRKWL